MTDINVKTYYSKSCLVRPPVLQRTYGLIIQVTSRDKFSMWPYERG